MDNELKETLRALLREELEPISKRLDKLEKGQVALKAGQENITRNIIDVLGQYTENIAKHIDDRADGIKEILKDQQRVIDTLSARSVKHESEIKDFKRILKNQ